MAKRKNDKNGAAPAGAVQKRKDSAAPKKKAQAKKPQPKKQGDASPGFWEKTKQFFREVRIELKKVTWPSRKETVASTSVVLVLVFLVAIYLGLVDMGLSRALKLLLN